MKVILKNLLMILLVILLVSWIFPNEAFAAASASISTSSTSIYVGETATISINVSNTETWEVTLTSSGGTLSNTKNGDAYGMEKTTTAMTSNFSANEPGTYTVSFSGTVAGSDLTTVIPVSGSVSINVKEKTTDTQIPNENKENTSNENKPNKNNVPTETKKPETSQVTKSSNNYLSSITVGTGTLSPEFYRDTLDYTE